MDAATAVLQECGDHGEFEPTCDYCGEGQCFTEHLEWNGETGCHVECEVIAGHRASGAAEDLQDAVYYYSIHRNTHGAEWLLSAANRMLASTVQP